MKSILKKTLIATVILGFLASCNKDDDAELVGSGEVELFFEHGMSGDELVLGNSYTNSNGESLTINRLNYIISNIVLFREDGTKYVYPKAESYFIVSQENDMHAIHLEGIPSENYTKVKFGVGVDRERYQMGETAQQGFWDHAKEHHMGTVWGEGYLFINFEGTFTSPNNVAPLNFQVHQGSSATADNYVEVVLQLPSTARVRQGDESSIHIVADANVILDGANKILLYDNLNTAGTGASIAQGGNLSKVAENTLAMFAVDHVHNGSAHDDGADDHHDDPGNGPY